MKRNLLFLISISLNIILVVIVAWGIIKMNFVKEQVLITEVQSNLIEWEGLIANQVDNKWSEPQLVTAELRDVLNGIWLGTTTGKQLGMFSKSEKKVLERLYSNLDQYPSDERYKFAIVTEEDKRDFEDLRKALREVGLGLNITISPNIDSFMGQAEALNKRINPH